jgi:hypothetical protein
VDFILWRFCTAQAGTSLLVLQDNILAGEHDQQLPGRIELRWTNTVVGDMKRAATKVSCGR